MRRILSLSVLALLAACVPKPPVAPVPPRPVAVPRPAPAPVPLSSDWRDWPLTPGTWRYSQDARGSVALFGEAGGDARLTLRCDRGERRIFLSRSGAAATPITVRTTSMTRAVPVSPAGGALPHVTAALAPTDPLLDAMGFSRGRFTVEQAGLPPLVLPAWAEVERVTQDCRD